MLNRKAISEFKTLVYRTPKEKLKRFIRIGPIAYFYEKSWIREMESAAKHICESGATRLKSSSDKELCVWFLTGDRFWFQSFFCAYSLALATERCLTVGLVDDGTFTDAQNRMFRRVFPRGKTIWHYETAESLDSKIPRCQYPTLRKRWEDYVNIRKLVDIHINDKSRKLVLDSDMLFFSRPNEMLDWYDRDDNSVLFMRDCVESYGYSRALMTQLCGNEIPHALNVGVCGLNGSLLDWAELESWCKSFVEVEGTSYFLEQAIVAMIGARNGVRVLPEKEYIVLPNKKQIAERNGALHHYVADSKIDYFRDAWKIFI